jgi:hypothetical protein
MGELVNTDNLPLGSFDSNYEISKIVDYKLEQQVIDMHLQGFKYSRIATKCNDLLKGRNDSKEYKPINHMNVKYFLESKIREIESGKSPLAPLSKSAIDVMSRLEQQILVYQSEIDKLRDPDNPITEARSNTFIRLNKELVKTLELISKIQGTSQPSITLNVFQTNISKFCDRITNSNFSNEIKAQIIEWAVQDLFPENSLKPADGKLLEG